MQRSKKDGVDMAPLDKISQTHDLTGYLGTGGSDGFYQISSEGQST